MSKETAQAPEISSGVKPDNESRVLPLAIAGLVCFAISLALGCGAWYLFGSRDADKIEQAALANVQKSEIPTAKINEPTMENAAPTSAETASQPETIQPETAQSAANQPEIEGVVKVQGGEFSIGGEANRPVQRFVIKDFAVAETEVTNAQYAEFVKETNHGAPPNWTGGKFPDGQENFPVTTVSWRNANAFCIWLSKKLGAEVRLPTEAEWELAAGGRARKKYPWGDEWNKEGGNSLETGGKTAPVKSFALNRSPSGAFDMVGNVWEWTSDKASAEIGATDKMVAEALKDGQILRIVKGGSASEKSSQISVRARYEIPQTTKVATVGFRYIVLPKQ